MPAFSIETFCSYVQEYKATFAYVVPPVVLALGKDPIVDKYDLSTLRSLASAAAPLSGDLVELAHARIRVRIHQGYGLSEMCAAVLCQPWADWKRKIGSCGILLPSHTAKIISPEGKELSAGNQGEIWVKGPNLFLEYLNNPTATSKCMSSDGYFKTGDIGYVDEEGYFYITDRLKEIIKYKGFQVSPAELEGVLHGSPDVIDAVVIGIYNASLASEVPRAYVVARQGVQLTVETAKRIRDFVDDRVARYKRLRGGVTFIEKVPKTASGKILRREIRDMVNKEIERQRQMKL